MKRKHDRAFTEIKNYYNDITLNNLAMISTLKEEIKAKEEKLERNEQVREDVFLIVGLCNRDHGVTFYSFWPRYNKRTRNWPSH